jgi:hypothetical protein
MQQDRLSSIFSELNSLLSTESALIDSSTHGIPHDRVFEHYRVCEARVEALLVELGGIVRGSYSRNDPN